MIPTDFILMPRTTFMTIPTAGASWTAVLKWANTTGKFSLGDQNANGSSVVLAAAISAARTNNSTHRAKVVSALKTAKNTAGNTSGGGDGRSLALAREAGAYVLAADLIKATTAELGFDPKVWAKNLLTLKCTDGKTITEIAAQRPNNWGTHARATCMVIDCYIGDEALLARQAVQFEGWLGNRAVYAGYKYGDLSWQSNKSAPVGINPKGATISGHNVDGVLPDDQRRAGGFTWPPPKENYCWEALQGVALSGTILSRAGYDVWNWSDKAILRAIQWLYTIALYPATGDDTFIIPIIEKAYGITFSHPVPTTPGKGFGFSDWLWGV